MIDGMGLGDTTCYILGYIFYIRVCQISMSRVFNQTMASGVTLMKSSGFSAVFSQWTTFNYVVHLLRHSRTPGSLWILPWPVLVRFYLVQFLLSPFQKGRCLRIYAEFILLNSVSIHPTTGSESAFWSLILSWLFIKMVSQI